MDLRCDECGAVLEVGERDRTAGCPYCDSPQVVERPRSGDRPAPRFALPFRIGRDEARQRIRSWIGGRRLFAPGGVRRAGLERLRGVYVPAYLYGARVRSEFSAEIGENYTETVTVGSGKNRRTVTRVRTEWRPLRGPWGGWVADVLVSASRGLSNTDLQAIEPYDWRDLVRFTPGVIAGWYAEEASLPRETCLETARGETWAQVGPRLAAHLPGDRQRNLEHRSTLLDESLEPLLVPVWVCALRHHPRKPPMQIILNGRTGAVHGRMPVSWIKVTAAALLGAGLAALVALWAAGVL